MQSGTMEGDGVDQLKMTHLILNTNGLHISKYRPINKQKGPINNQKIQLMNEPETPKKKEEENPRIGRIKEKKPSLFSARDTKQRYEGGCGAL